MYVTINSNNIVFGTDATSQDDVVERASISHFSQNFIPAGLYSAARPGNRQQTCQVIIHMNGGKKKIFDLADVSNQPTWFLTKAGLNTAIAAMS